MTPRLNVASLSFDTEDTDCSDETVYWSRDDFVKIVETFRLPKRFAQMIARCQSSFSVSSLINKDGAEDRFGYIFSTMFHHQPFWLMAASYDPETKVTCAFLHCTADPDEKCIERITKYIKRMASLAPEPLLLPILIIDLETNLTMRDDQQYTQLLGDITHTDEIARLVPAKLSEISAQLKGAAIFLSLIEREGHSVMTQLQDIQTELQPSWYRRDTPQQLLVHLKFLISSRKNLSLRINGLQKRVNIHTDDFARRLTLPPLARDEQTTSQ
jgi:hypothetical protein